MADDSPLLSLTVDDVRQWRREYDAFSAEIARLRGQQRTLRQRFDALPLFLPPDKVQALTADLPAFDDNVADSSQPIASSTRVRSRPEMPMTDAVLEALAGENGGRSPRWLREKLSADPDFRERVLKSPTGISNALSRLVEREKLIRNGGLYYLPDTFDAIQRGLLQEDQSEPGSSTSFNSVMHDVMRAWGKPFNAGDALTQARQNEYLLDRIGQQPSRVYSWLSREVFKNKLIKDGEFYSYPSERDGAPIASASSAPNAGEVAASPSNDRGGFNDLLG